MSRGPNNLELWWIAPNGSVQNASWLDGQKAGNCAYGSTWSCSRVASAGSASIDGGIAAVARNPNGMALSWIGVNGAIRYSFWDAP